MQLTLQPVQNSTDNLVQNQPNLYRNSQKVVQMHGSIPFSQFSLCCDDCCTTKFNQIDHLVLLSKDTLSIYSSSCEYLVSIPRTKRIQPLKNGLLLLGDFTYFLASPFDSPKIVELRNVETVLQVEDGDLVIEKTETLISLHKLIIENNELKVNNLFIVEEHSVGAFITKQGNSIDLLWVMTPAEDEMEVTLQGDVGESVESLDMQGFYLKAYAIADQKCFIPVHEYRVKSACILNNTNILILTMDNLLKLWIGHDQLITCEAKYSEENTKRKYSENNTRSYERIVDLIQSGNQALVKFANGKLFSVDIDFTQTTFLVRQCLHALEYSLPLKDYQLYLHRFLVTLNGDLTNEDDSEWDVFMIVLLSFFHQKIQVIKDIEDDDRTDWEWLTQSSEALDLKSILPSTISDMIITEPSNSLDRLILRSKSVHFLYHNEKNFIKYGKDILYTFFYVYEDFGLDSTLSGHCIQLGSLLKVLSCILNSKISMYLKIDGIDWCNHTIPE
jgi:hypothetical protein